MSTDFEGDFLDIAARLHPEMVEALDTVEDVHPVLRGPAPAGVVPAGFGLADADKARKALADARGDVQKTLDAHHAWLDMVEEMPLAVEKARQLSIRSVRRAGAIGAVGGTAVGFGLAELLRLVVR